MADFLPASLHAPLRPGHIRLTRVPHRAPNECDLVPGDRLSQCTGCGRDHRDPHASCLTLEVDPQAAYANIARLRSLYPDITPLMVFYDAVKPSTGPSATRL
jgi:hypothetical protein